jgi:hypothetical protein
MSVGGAHRGTGVAVVVAPNPPRTAVLRRPEQTKRDKGEERKAAGCFDWLSFVLMRRGTMGGHGARSVTARRRGGEEKEEGGGQSVVREWMRVVAGGTRHGRGYDGDGHRSALSCVS